MTSAKSVTSDRRILQDGLHIVDTPGLFDTGRSFASCIALSAPGYHCFTLKEAGEAIRDTQTLFGERVMKHVFTGKDALDKSKESVGVCIKDLPETYKVKPEKPPAFTEQHHRSVAHPVMKFLFTTLLFFGRIQYIAGSRVDIEALVGSTATFDLPYQTSLPDPECFLNKTPLEIRNDERYSMEMTGGKLRFTIQNVSLDHAGIYSCISSSTQQDTGVHVTVTDIGFKWLPTDMIVSSNYETAVKLKWRYEAAKLPNKIIFIRYDKHSTRRETVGVWTKDSGFIMRRIGISTHIDVTVYNGEELVLKLFAAYPIDFDLLYTCQMFYGNHVFFDKDVELKAIKPEVTGTPEVVKGTPGQDVMFVWKYEYNYPIWRAVFLLDHPYTEELGYWFGGNYILNEVDPVYKERVVSNMAEIGTRWEITLTLLNTVVSDYNRTYYCRVVGQDGYEGRGEIYLQINDSDLNIEPQESPEQDRSHIVPASPSNGSCATPFCLLIFLMTTFALFRMYPRQY